jgi:hypothetical protein
MTSEEIKMHVAKVMPVGDLAFWMREIAYHLALRNESSDILADRSAGKKDAVSEGGMLSSLQIQAARIRELQGELDAANRHVKILRDSLDLVNRSAGKGDAVSEGRTLSSRNPQGPEYQIRDVLEGLNLINTIAAATQFQINSEYPTTLERIREIVERIRAIEVGNVDFREYIRLYFPFAHKTSLWNLAAWGKDRGWDDSEGSTERAEQQPPPRSGEVSTESEQGRAIAASLRACAQTIMGNRMEGPEAAAYVSQYADTVERAGQQPPPRADEPVTESGRGPKRNPHG